MFCKNCGSEIGDYVRFCTKCGAPQQAAPVTEPPKQAKKKSKKVLPVVISLVLVVALLAAAAVAILLPRKETVYVLTGYRAIRSDVSATEYEYEWDASGNLCGYLDLRNAIGYEYEYDDLGNMTEVTYHRLSSEPFTTEYDYEYDDKNRIQSMESYSVEWEYTWDKKGNLTQVCSDEPNTVGLCRADFCYDKKNRLTQEYLFTSVRLDGGGFRLTLWAYEYIYDEDGHLTEVNFAQVPDCDMEDDPEDLDIEFQTAFGLEYDREGRMEALSYYDRTVIYAVIYNGEEFDQTELKLEYDSDGNPDLSDVSQYGLSLDYEATYDEHGNLLTLEVDGGYTYEYEYEEVEMTRDAAQRYRFWVRHKQLDPTLRFTLYYNALNLGFVRPANMDFFYYLIPNPFW